MEYVIEKATMEDLPRIEEIYAHARSFMAKTGNPNQWGTSHPSLVQLRRDNEKGSLYGVKNGGEIHGVFYFCVEPDPTYAVIYDGNWHGDRPYGVIHRIASDGSDGILRAAVRFALIRTDYLRIDTHRDNAVMQGALSKQGFQKCGTIHLADGSTRIAYDLML